MAPLNPAFPPLAGVPITGPNGILTPAGLNLFQQLWTAVFGQAGLTPGIFLLGYLDAINFNVAGDKQINLILPSGAFGWRAALGLVYGTNGSFSTAEAGIYSVPFQQGTALIGQTALSGITATGSNTPGAVAELTPDPTAIWTYSTVYLNVGTAQNGVSLGNLYLYGYPAY